MQECSQVTEQQFISLCLPTSLFTLTGVTLEFGDKLKRIVTLNKTTDFSEFERCRKTSGIKQDGVVFRHFHLEMSRNDPIVAKFCRERKNTITAVSDFFVFFGFVLLNQNYLHSSEATECHCNLGKSTFSP